MQPSTASWPTEYVNRERGKPYQPHHEEERQAVYGYAPRFVLMRGGEGSGKTSGGAVKGLERIKFGLDGIVVAPDFPHFKRSTWPEFRRWIPWDFVIPKQRYRAAIDWSPATSFELVFTTGAVVYCGGIDDPISWEGPNVNWAWFDEARRKRDPQALKVLNGRVRIPGPPGVPPQLWLTTTPFKHWLYDYFGPLKENDPLESFKRRRLDVILRTADNLDNLDPDYVEDRSAGLTEAERRVLLEGGWEDIDDGARFLASMLWWDVLEEELQPLEEHEPLVLALDASVSGDSFAIVGVTQHPDRARTEQDVAVRYARAWLPTPGEKLEYSTQAGDGPEDELRRLLERFNVVKVVYDEYQLHDMMTRIRQEGLAEVEAFNQGAARLEADAALQARIMRRGLAHSGEPELRQHIDNADRKMDPEERRLRIVKRTESQKVDLAVALSMAAKAAESMAFGLPWAIVSNTADDENEAEAA